MYWYFADACLLLLAGGLSTIFKASRKPREAAKLSFENTRPGSRARLRRACVGSLRLCSGKPTAVCGARWLRPVLAGWAPPGPGRRSRVPPAADDGRSVGCSIVRRLVPLWSIFRRWAALEESRVPDVISRFLRRPPPVTFAGLTMTNQSEELSSPGETRNLEQSRTGR